MMSRTRRRRRFFGSVRADLLVPYEFVMRLPRSGEQLPAEDAAHIAIAVTNGIDYLVTWKLSAHCQRRDAIPYRTRVPAGRLRACGHLHAQRTDGAGPCRRHRLTRSLLNSAPYATNTPPGSGTTSRQSSRTFNRGNRLPVAITFAIQLDEHLLSSKSERHRGTRRSPVVACVYRAVFLPPSWPVLATAAISSRKRTTAANAPSLGGYLGQRGSAFHQRRTAERSSIAGHG